MTLESLARITLVGLRLLETRYSTLERTCCALVWTAHRLRHYLLNYTTMLIARMDPLKYIFDKPSLTGRIARWQMLLTEFDMVYVTQKAIKGQAIADQLAENPIPVLLTDGPNIPRRIHPPTRRRISNMANVLRRSSKPHRKRNRSCPHFPRRNASPNFDQPDPFLKHKKSLTFYYISQALASAQPIQGALMLY